MLCVESMCILLLVDLAIYLLPPFYDYLVKGQQHITKGWWENNRLLEGWNLATKKGPWLIIHWKRSGISEFPVHTCIHAIPNLQLSWKSKDRYRKVYKKFCFHAGNSTSFNSSEWLTRSQPYIDLIYCDHFFNLADPLPSNVCDWWCEN